MSTLNSSQIHVKRSSTRLHAPPGGASSLSFGPGGFGTTDHLGADNKQKQELVEPASRSGYPPSYGGYSTSGSNQSDAYAPHAFHCIKPSNSQSSTPYYPEPTQAGWPPSSGGYQPYPGPGISSAGRPASTHNNFSWGEQGSQPPLTASRRDQNWEKKRRQWLARKNASGNGSAPPPPGTAMPRGGPGFSLPPPPSTSYGYDDSYNPPSPLTKFVAQQQQQAQRPPQTASYDRLSTASSQYDSMGRPPSSGMAMPPRTSSNSSHSVPRGLGTPYQNSYELPPSTTASVRDPYVYGAVPGTAMSTASRPGPRQPPGGQTNWSPYS